MASVEPDVTALPAQAVALETLEPVLCVEVVFAPCARTTQAATLRLHTGATLGNALMATGWPALSAAALGDEAWARAGLRAAVWGRSRPLDTPLREGDRIEVLRPLALAPMEARRLRYEAAGGVKALRRRGYAAQKR